MSKIKHLFSVLKNEIEKKTESLNQNEVDRILEDQFFEDASVLGKTILFTEEETEDENSLIHLAVINDKPNWLEAILKIVDKDPEKVEHTYSPSNYIRKLKNISGLKLLPNKIINLVNGAGKTCVHLAAERNYDIHIEILIKFHANLNLLCKKKVSPLGYAIEKNHLPIVELLLKSEAEVDIKCGEFQMTPLQSACAKGYISIVKILIKFFADVKATDKLGRTPLYFAKYFGHETIVSMLENKIGKTADNFYLKPLSEDYIVLTEEEKKLIENLEIRKMEEKVDFSSLMRSSQGGQTLYLQNKTLEETKKDLRSSFKKLNIKDKDLKILEDADHQDNSESKQVSKKSKDSKKIMIAQSSRPEKSSFSQSI